MKLSCARCGKRLSRKSACLIDKVVLCRTCMFAPPPKLRGFDPSHEPLWYLTKDGDVTILALYERHYSSYDYKDGRDRSQFVGPGEHIVLRTDRGDAGFVWRRFIDDSGERGVNCAFFRNESPYQSSELVRQACAIADFVWPGARLYTYVDQKAVRSAHPGSCFMAARWKRLKRLTGSGKRILELRLPTCRERIEARRAETGNTGSVHESRVSAGNLAHPPAIQEQ